MGLLPLFFRGLFCAIREPVGEAVAHLKRPACRVPALVELPFPAGLEPPGVFKFFRLAHRFAEIGVRLDPGVQRSPVDLQVGGDFDLPKAFVGEFEDAIAICGVIAGRAPARLRRQDFEIGGHKTSQRTWRGWNGVSAALCEWRERRLRYSVGRLCKSSATVRIYRRSHRRGSRPSSSLG